MPDYVIRPDRRRPVLKKALALTAAAGLVIAPIAAQANSRAVDSAVSLDRAAMPVGAAQGLSDDDDDGIGGLWWLFGGAILIGVALAVMGDTEEDNATPGAN